MSYILPAITPDEIRLFSKYFYELSGIILGPEKGYLLENRFSQIMGERQCTSFSELYYTCKGKRDRPLEQNLIDAITTHETSFFRDNAPFELLQREIIPKLVQERGKDRAVDAVPMPLSIWSAACSTGQEAYSIAMVLQESLQDLKKYSIKLLGSDISDRAIQKARAGKYSQYEIKRGLSKERIVQFFQKNEAEERWAISPKLKAITKFQKINLIHPFDEIGTFDVIFCRNVAVYFSQADRNRFFRNIAQAMTPESYLVVGSTESLNELKDLFIGTQEMGAAYYRLR